MNQETENLAALYRGALSINQAYGLTGIDPRTLKRAIERGQLLALRPPGTDRWRIPETVLTEWLAAGLPKKEGK